MSDGSGLIRRSCRSLLDGVRDERLWVRAVRAAVAATVAAVALVAASLAVDYGVPHSSVTAAVVAWAGVLGVAAGVACAVLLAGLALLTAAARLWHLRRHAATTLSGRGHKAGPPQP